MSTPMSGRAAARPRGDEDALFRQHHAALLHAVRGAVRAPDACVEDACSFAWLQLLRCQPDRRTVFGWLRTVAMHEVYRLSRRGRREPYLEDLGHGCPEVLANDAGEQARTRAHEVLLALSELPARQRRYLALFAAGFSYREICELTGASLTNVKKHMTRAELHSSPHGGGGLTTTQPTSETPSSHVPAPANRHAIPASHVVRDVQLCRRAVAHPGDPTEMEEPHADRPAHNRSARSAHVLRQPARR